MQFALNTYTCRLYPGSLLHNIVMIIHYYSCDNSILNSYEATLYYYVGIISIRKHLIVV